MKPAEAADVAALFLNLFGSAEFDARAAARLLRSDAAADVLQRHAIEMELDLGIELPLPAMSAKP